MTRFYRIFVCVIMLMLGLQGWAESKWSISGKIADSETKEPI